MPVSHDTAVELVRDLLELQRVMKRVTKTDAGQRQLNPTAIALLYYLDSTGPRRATVMASDTGLGPSGLSRQLAGLEDAGLVERTPDPEDGRAALVAITGRGREQVRAVVEQDAQRLAARLVGWDEDQARASRGAINEITTVFLDSLGAERTTSCRETRRPPRAAPATAGGEHDGEHAEHPGSPRPPQHRHHEEETAR
ncbi:MarR family transcriptional regulator [Kocuria sediminis]|uniref:MarR family transcriptional regulator n=1 Tax=Kocuria sediminis TaxID=1038857 RepID=A0A6N8GT51_9MICC|nr:MarR family winged helix-turn-helix transcriptional regulator [Kocuria sediminis]MUN64493.1 MarR family transcriptional regulator [Kocuria sediminis]